ncbi:carbon monoxide dehydrogenase E protein [Alloactinosynnema sp. L-07]|uniref:VWA domain-containing protein n=1 Tax=Alloactinosynnema sp. L-07 TaxID=1653480 RepID=UPI00065EFCA0|nr:VWA domain-containing protein [Alloactinosynnema sp. L-07]CRK59005.1 carbon monoxide dehydrogenase E protein [Alloactinosynnema sp. L-07]
MAIVERHIAFLGALREAGLPVSLAEGLDAAHAMAAVDIGERESLRAAYATTVVKRQAHREAFDALFDLWFPRAVGDGVQLAPERGSEVEVTGGVDRSPSVVANRRRLAELVFDGDLAGLDQLAMAALAEFGRLPGDGPARWSPAAALDTLTPRTLMAGLVRTAAPTDTIDERDTRRRFTERIARFERAMRADAQRRIAEERGVPETARWVARPTVDRVDFLTATADDLANLRREVYPLARRLATKMSRRRGRRGLLDFRRTIRLSLATGGVPIRTRHRPRRPHKPELVVLCDISSSVSSFARFTLLLVYALREQFSRVRAFAFVDTPVEVTRYFAASDDVRAALSRMEADGVRFLSGGTNYGKVFVDLAAKHSTLIGPNTALLILGDARSNYLSPETGVLSDLAALARHAHWLNPEPIARWGTGDSAAPAYAEVIEMVECRNLAQLARFVERLA